MINKHTVILAAMMATFVVSGVSAAEMDHSGHETMTEQTEHQSHDMMDGSGKNMSMDSNMDHEMMSMDHDAMQRSDQHQQKKMTVQSPPLALLHKMPTSGKGREAGYDKRYVMEPTSAENSVDARCAKASRGIMMVDNATWAKCGGKPEGWSKGAGAGIIPSSGTSRSSSSHHMH